MATLPISAGTGRVYLVKSFILQLSLQVYFFSLQSHFFKGEI